MDQVDSQIHLIQEKLANEGSEFSYEEIEDVFRVLKQASLKIIVANVPRAVFSDAIAQRAFEDHFKSYDPQCSFVYLSSFNRAQVYMERPEAALCARLQSQGWKLPADVASLVDNAVGGDCAEGISCFIDHVDDEDELSESPSMEDETDDLECTCGLGTDSTINLVEPALCQETCLTDPSGLKHELQDVSGNIELPEQQQQQPYQRSSTSSEHEIPSSGGLKDLSADLRMGTPECENASEACGDDAASGAPPNLHKAFCPKFNRGKSRRQSGMKHLAPPKPSRLFLLSPPASPPVGWEPKPESEPVLNYELLEALAALAPGEAFELHPRDQAGRHPSIVITPCETHSMSVRPRIVQTPCPKRNS